MGQVVDATPYYGVLSVIILPINSILNPILYSDSVYGMVEKWTRLGWDAVKRFVSFLLVKMLKGTPEEPTENIEMGPVQNNNDDKSESE